MQRLYLNEIVQFGSCRDDLDDGLGRVAREGEWVVLGK